MGKRLPGSTVAEKLALNHVVDGECWRWTGAHTRKGYGQLKVNGRVQSVHRLAYEEWVGEIPNGHDVDHVAAAGCRHRDCIRPEHLEAVTHAENIARMVALITHCPQGHEYTPENTIVGTKGNGYRARHCRTCKSRYQRAYKARVKGAAA